jgi:hypothetical protein
MFRQAWRHNSVFCRATQAYRAVSSSRYLQKATDLETKPPQPGTVAPYEQHVFIRFPPKQAPDAAQGGWWPKIVERWGPGTAFQALRAGLQRAPLTSNRCMHAGCRSSCRHLEQWQPTASTLKASNGLLSIPAKRSRPLVIFLLPQVASCSRTVPETPYIRMRFAGVVRISAYEEADLSVRHPARAGKCDMMLFPSGE